MSSPLPPDQPDEAVVAGLIRDLIGQLELGPRVSPDLLVLFRSIVLFTEQFGNSAGSISGISVVKAVLYACIESGRLDFNNLDSPLVWIYEWLLRRYGLDRIDDLYEALHGAVLSNSHYLSTVKELAFIAGVGGVFDRAALISETTRGHRNFELRHLLAAIAISGYWPHGVKGALGPPDWTDRTTRQFAIHLVDNIMKNPTEGETRERWATALAPYLAPKSAPRKRTVQQSRSPEESPATAVASQIDPDQLTPFNNDLAISGDDLLDTGADVRALSRLAALKGAAPLAMAIFGGWGAGKSTFMARMEREIDAICADDEPAFVRKVVHIRFNAWQFADANIWASLTAEFFDQLRAGGHGQTGAHRLARLVEQVNARVHALSNTMDTAELALEQSREAVRLADEKRLDAAHKADGAALRAVAGSVLLETQVLLDRYKGQIDQLKLSENAGVQLSNLLGILHTVASSASTGMGRLGSVFHLLSRNGWWVLALVGISIAIGGVLITDLVNGQSTIAGFVVNAGLFAVAAASAWWQIKPAVEVTLAVAKSAQAILLAASKANRETTASLIKAEHELSDALLNVRRREHEHEQVKVQLSRYLDPDGRDRGQRPRLLHYVLEDDPDGRTLEAGIGLIGRARRLFNAVHLIIQSNTEKADGVRDDNLPERIVIYIDDLDRCSFDQVYAVLQAVHLLLAFESFVVVVGVDPAWVQGTLTHAVVRASGATVDSEATAEHRHKAALYLDKIFQVALWLNPLDSEGDGGGTFGSFVRALCVPREPDVPATKGGEVLPAEASPSGGDQQGSSPVMSGEPVPETAGSTAPVPSTNAAESSVAESGATTARTTGADAKAAAAFMRLDEREIAFLASDTIARICEPTPRTAKRMVNSYRLLRSRLAETGRPVLTEGTYQALAIAVAAGICSRPGTVEALRWRLADSDVRDAGDILGVSDLALEHMVEETPSKDRHHLEVIRRLQVQDAVLIKQLSSISAFEFGTFLHLAVRHACTLEAKVLAA